MDDILVIGGTRSGKSGYALKLGESLLKEGEKGLFIATAQPRDEEMAARIKLHQAERGDCWETMEEPVEVTRAMERNQLHFPVIVLDCITLWLANLQAVGAQEAEILEAVKGLAEQAVRSRAKVIFVSNELGMGVVPVNETARGFRDMAGKANQILAKRCRQVIFTVAGIPIFLKGGEDV